MEDADQERVPPPGPKISACLVSGGLMLSLLRGSVARRDPDVIELVRKAPRGRGPSHIGRMVSGVAAREHGVPQRAQRRRQAGRLFLHAHSPESDGHARETERPFFWRSPNSTAGGDLVGGRLRRVETPAVGARRAHQVVVGVRSSRSVTHSGAGTGRSGTAPA